MRISSLFSGFLTHSAPYPRPSQNGKETVSSFPAIVIKVAIRLSKDHTGKIMTYLEWKPDADRYQLLRGIASGLAYLHGELALKLTGNE